MLLDVALIYSGFTCFGVPFSKSNCNIIKWGTRKMHPTSISILKGMGQHPTGPALGSLGVVPPQGIRRQRTFSVVAVCGDSWKMNSVN